MDKDIQWLLQEKYSGLRNPNFDEDCKRLAQGEPLAYVIGWQPFLGLKIYLDSHPLIPRPETEWWTEQMLQNAAARQPKDVSDGDGRRASKFSAENYACPERGEPLRLLDLCAGSGAIGCAALKALPTAEVYFGEIDPAHEATIQKNIAENGLDATRARLSIGDLFEPFPDLQFDIIASNPPYIPTGRTLDRSVADFEPARALFGGAAGLDHIRRIAGDLRAHLAPGGKAWIECDSDHADAALRLFVDHGFTAEILTDQYQAPRVIVVS